MKPTDTANPEYFHKVVDCQWGCPAHTDVPAYIRMIAQGQFSDAYMENRESNVFPGILGRVCDRPCEPACRRGRVEEKPVAICRLKRVAADHRDDITDRLPKAPPQNNGKHVALIGAGCASLTVANDLRPLGYEVTIFEALDATGGLMRTNIPRFRLPPKVLDEEIGYILDMGVDLKLNHPIESLKNLLDEDYDAIFVGTGAPRGKNLEIPGRYDSDRIHIGIDWLESVAFEHIESIGEHVLIIGVGNTAMDCCRTSLRLGAKEVKVMARKPRGFFKASTWELEDAEEENVEILVNHSPKEFVIEDGKLVGMRFELMEYTVDKDGGIDRGRVTGEKVIPCDDVVLAIGQDNAFPWIERDLGIEFDKWECPVVDETTMMCGREGVFFGGDSAFGPKNIIWAVEHGHQAAISMHKYCQGEDIEDRLPMGLNLASQKMGMHEWSYSNDYDPSSRRLMPHVDLKQRFKKLDIEVELGFTVEQTIAEVERCLNCDIQTVFTESLCIECDACIDICPVNCLTITKNGDEDELRTRLSAPAENRDQALYVSAELPHTGRVMVKDEDICVHCGLCAERCPTGAWDMQKSTILIPYARMNRRLLRSGPPRAALPNRGFRVASVNDVVIKIGTVNGTGSASANGLLRKSIFRMGVPVVGKNYFPSNIQGLPTWYEIRVTGDGYQARSNRVDVMVAMNAQTYAQDMADVTPGGWLIYDSTWPRSRQLNRDDITVIGIPFSRMCNEHFNGARARILMKNIAYVGALAALLDLDLDIITGLLEETYAAKKKLIASNMEAITLGYDFASENFPCPLPARVQKMEATKSHIVIDGNTAAGLGCMYAGATVGAWYPITPSTSLMDAFRDFCQHYRVDPETDKRTYCIIQAEDELAAIGMVLGASWMGARSFTPTSGPGISLMNEFIGFAYYAEIPAVIFDVQRVGPSTGMPTRTQQCDIMSCAYASHGDTMHVLLFPADPAECFYMAVQAFDLAERLQTPIMVLSDLDIGMNDWMVPELEWDENYVPDRGKVLGAEELEKMEKFYRYLDVDGDGIPYRTLPGCASERRLFHARLRSYETGRIYRGLG